MISFCKNGKLANDWYRLTRLRPYEFLPRDYRGLRILHPEERFVQVAFWPDIVLVRSQFHEAPWGQNFRCGPPKPALPPRLPSWLRPRKNKWSYAFVTRHTTPPQMGLARGERRWWRVLGSHCIRAQRRAGPAARVETRAPAQVFA